MSLTHREEQTIANERQAALNAQAEQHRLQERQAEELRRQEDMRATEARLAEKRAAEQKPDPEKLKAAEAENRRILGATFGMIGLCAEAETIERLGGVQTQQALTGDHRLGIIASMGSLFGLTPAAAPTQAQPAAAQPSIFNLI